MDCRAYQNDLKELAAEAVSPRREAALRTHLELCAACRAVLAVELELFRGLDAALRKELNPVLPPGLAARIRASVQSEPVPLPRSIPAWAFAAAFAVFAACFVWVQVNWRASGPRNPKPANIATEVPSVKSAAPAEPESFARAARRPAAREAYKPRKKMAVRAREPQVLVPPGQQEAVARFLSGLQRGDVKGEMLLADRRNSELPLPAIAPLEFEPVDVKPLETAQPELH